MDDDLHEPVGDAGRAALVVVQAQIADGRSEFVESAAGGVVLDTNGYLVVRKFDIDRLGYVPKRGDRIVKLGTATVNLYLAGFNRRGHWSAEGGHTLVKLHYMDREPTHRDGDL